MPKEKSEIINFLNEIATYLELLNENPFKVRSYRNAAEIVEKYDGDINEGIESGKLFEIKGIGSSITEKIKSFYYDKNLDFFYELKNKVPAGLIELLNIPSLGPKRTYQLWKELNITNINELEKACLENKLVQLKNFGVEYQNKILKGIELLKNYEQVYYYSEAKEYAEKLVEFLKTSKLVSKIEIAGSIRRYKETIKDIDILVCAKNYKKINNFISTYSDLAEITASGETKISFRLKSGISVDIRIVKKDEFPFALHYFTGSKEHNTIIRQYAKKYNLKLNEYGLFTDKNEKIKCKDEKELFNKLNLEYIEPELRENRGEIEAAEKKELPKLIKESDIKGIFHIHTIYSDGANKIEDYVKWAIANNIEYIGIADHSQSAAYAKGLKIDMLKKQIDEINELNNKYNEVKILKGIESDILKNGELDYPDEILEQLDFVIGSVHSNFNLTEEEMTERIIKAIKNPYLNIIGHISGRLLKERNGYKINYEKIFDLVSEYNKIIEFNAQPQRFDIDWRYLKICKNRNIKIVIGIDAHSIDYMHYVKFGVGFCRKGWLEKKDVINTFSFSEVKKLFKKH
ncbi:MAG TPA: DNA polymerase/3'-5' exonuclease PolX [bacterium]|nr:DNA polymerase/3'-5' exonuclease PolX [bacterium]HPQ19143.1 DNA polymerase/3'-5' exonuclease PolX [bacterium]